MKYSGPTYKVDRLYETTSPTGEKLIASKILFGNEGLELIVYCEKLYSLA